MKNRLLFCGCLFESACENLGGAGGGFGPSLRVPASAWPMHTPPSWSGHLMAPTPSQLLVHFSRSTIILSQPHARTRAHAGTQTQAQSEIKAPSTRPQPPGHLPNQILSPHSSSLLLLPNCHLLLQRLGHIKKKLNLFNFI